MKELRVTAIQATSVAGNWEEKWAGVDVPHALELLDEASTMGSDIVCFPELYPLVGEQELLEKAKELNIYIVAGLAEGGTQKWHNTSTIISPFGGIVGRQTKNYPTALELDNGVVAGNEFNVYETDIGRLGIVICADFAFFNDGVQSLKDDNVDILFNPAVWFALSEAFPHTVIGRHMEYSVPMLGVNLGRPSESRSDALFPPAGGFSTICVPPQVANMDELWSWFRDKSGGIDSTDGFIYTLGPKEEIKTVRIDIDAVRKFPGYFSTRSPAR